MAPGHSGQYPLGLFSLFFFPGPLWGFNDDALFDGRGGHTDIAHLSVNDRFDALKVGHEPALGNRCDVRSNAAALFGFTTAPNDAALHRALAGQFTDSCHTNPVSKLKSLRN